MSTQTKNRTKTKARRETEAFPLSPEMTGHEPLVETPPIDESQLYESITNKAEAMIEAIRLTGRFYALMEHLEKEKLYGLNFVEWAQKTFGAFDQIVPTMNTPQTNHVDRRKIFNPPKNLKISARRSFIWAKAQGKSADEAYQRACEVVNKKARTDYSMSKVPEGVQDYIENVYKHYDMVGKGMPIPIT